MNSFLDPMLTMKRVQIYCWSGSLHSILTVSKRKYYRMAFKAACKLLWQAYRNKQTKKSRQRQVI